ncbi:predicted protein [Naegleria gruberi]|uniref:Predicted protein n=1 Tax=Naegleria gruberi TaxID=5762 RepID=D2VDB6_NAEGR|nr:uncharacterized protein NAEGRDRAFT_66787 [Naegleria gruberi]EFC45115.1 predicted protein [Naegleria gruberi]|eukprot:XP_002677859.1 predicted protein [Naegleria gruberi strain NEG-M]
MPFRSKNVFLLVFLIMLSWYLLVDTSLGSSDYNISYIDWKTLKKIDSSTLSSSSIIAADNFTSLFVWNDLFRMVLQNNTFDTIGLEWLFNYDAELKFFTFDTTLTVEVMKQMMEFIGRDVMRNSFYSLPKLWKFKQILMNKNTECIYGSVFEVFDIMIGTNIEFVERIRLNRNHRQFKKKSSDYLNPSDFYSIPLFPNNFWMLNSLNGFNSQYYESIVQKLAESLALKSSFQNYTSCTDSLKHDSIVLERLHGVMNFTSTQLEWSLKFSNISSSSVPQNFTFLQQAMEVFYQNNQDYLFWNQSKVQQYLWTSSCFQCSSANCVSERWAWVDTLDITVVCMAVLYYLVLFASGAFRSPVIYRKYPIVFFCPFIVMGMYSSMVNSFNNGCISVGVIFTVYLAALLNVIYICTVVRYYYLRNLYNIIKNSKHPKLFKYLSSELVGFVFTVIFPIPTAFVATIPIFIIVQTYNSLIVNTTNNVIIVLFCAISCFAGVSFFIYEAIRNRKLIAKFGLGRFLLFEEPYYFRIDLLALGLMILLLILLAILFLVLPNSIVAIRFVIGLTLYMLTGGTSLLMLFIENVRNGNVVKQISSETKHSNAEYIEIIKNNSNKDLVELFRLYSEKSLALENILLMDELVGFKRRSENIKIEDLKKVHEMYLTAYSAYEVNVSSIAKSTFEKDLRDAEAIQSLKVRNEVVDQIMKEVEMNLISTFSRFTRTNEFRQWREIYQLQKDRVAVI